MAFRFVAVVACLAVAAANPIPYPHPHARVRPSCPKAPLPEIHPTVVKSVLPAPVNIGPQKAEYIEHAAYPYEINYFEKPYVVKHKQSAALNVYTQKPVVVDEYAKPVFQEVAGPQAVIVEEVFPYAEAGAGAGAAGGQYGAGGAQYGAGAQYGEISYAAPAPGCAPVVPVYPPSCH
ncbi:unnamed protein product [Bemisia tabaci]|uniref:Cuticular protein n=1 Tax=Bemisia tabaci TaxID=7038 RepID=A0A9P0A782_BEMTA|nr:unnamed protein product [Bemisia tabaci]